MRQKRIKRNNIKKFKELVDVVMETLILKRVKSFAVSDGADVKKHNTVKNWLKR